MAVISGKKGALAKKMKRLTDAGEDIPEEMRAEVERYDNQLTEMKGLGEAERRAKRRANKRATYARKKKEKEEEERKMMSEMDGEETSDDEDMYSDSDSDAPRSPKLRTKPLKPDWTATPLGCQRNSASVYIVNFSLGAKKGPKVCGCGSPSNSEINLLVRPGLTLLAISHKFSPAHFTAPVDLPNQMN